MKTTSIVMLLAAVALLRDGRVASSRRSAIGGVAQRVFVVERAHGTLAVYDLVERRVTHRIEGFGDLRHATMTFSPDLRWGFVATRSGVTSRVDLSDGTRDLAVRTSDNSIDLAIAQDGRSLAIAEYYPGGVTIVDPSSMRVRARLPGTFDHAGRSYHSRVTGIVDAPRMRFVCALIEGREVWVIDMSTGHPRIEHRIGLQGGLPYDAMITPDGRYYIVGQMDSADASLVDLERPELGARTISLRDRTRTYDQSAPVKLPHLASWAVAGRYVFVPGLGEERLIVLDRHDWTFVRSIPVRGHPVYAVRSPSERDIWVSFSGAEHDRYVQVVDTETLAVTATLDVGRRIYHMDFVPRGAYLLASANGDDQLVMVDTLTHAVVDREPVRSPSGIFGPWRAFALGL